VRGQRTLPAPLSNFEGRCESSILLHCPCCAWQARFTPHPRPLSPVRGDGSEILFLPESQRHWAAACGQTAMPPPRQRPHQRAHLRCETQPGASAQPLTQPHGGSLRANAPAYAPPTPSPARAPSVRNAAGGSRPTADTAAWRQPAGKRPANAPPTPSAARAPSVRNTAGGFRPTAGTAAWRQPAGKRPANALGSARTFGAKHSRGLPPNR